MFFPLQQIFPQKLKNQKQGWNYHHQFQKKGLKHILLPASSARFLKAAKSSWWLAFWFRLSLSSLYNFPCHLVQCFFLNAHIQVYEKKQQQQLKHLLVVKKFFHPKSKPRKKLVHQKAWDSHRMTRIKKSTRKNRFRRPQKIQKPRFYSYVPFDDSVFFNKNNKEIPTKKKIIPFFSFVYS